MTNVSTLVNLGALLFFFILPAYGRTSADGVEKKDETGAQSLAAASSVGSTAEIKTANAHRDPVDSDHCLTVHRPILLRLATGQVQGVYYNVGRKLREVIEKTLSDVCVEIWLTDGALDNLDLLRDRQVDLALIQNDIVAKSIPQSSIPKTVLALMQESIQVVVGPVFQGDTVSSLSSHPLALGPAKSGTRFTTKIVLANLNITPAPEVLAEKPFEMIEVLRKDTAHGEFFVSGSPNPKVAMLLSDPYFRLLGFQTKEIRSILDEPSADGKSKRTPYAVTTIEEHTYPHQNSSVTTVAVTALLMCKPDEGSDLISRLTKALLSDVDSSESSIRRSLTTIDLPLVLELTRKAEFIAPLHDGARSAIGQLEFFQRHQELLHLGMWSVLLTIALSTLAASHFRALRLGLLSVVTHPTRLSLIYALRMLTNSLSESAGTYQNARPKPSVTRIMKMMDRAPENSYRFLRRLLFHRMLWQVVRTLSLVIVVWLIASLVMYYCERNVNVNFANIRLSSLSILVYLFSGLEDRAPVTDQGWIGAVVTLLSGLLLVAYITGQFASEIVQSTFGVAGMNRNATKGGFFVIGWNARAELIVRELFGAFEAGFGEHKVSVLLGETTFAREGGGASSKESTPNTGPYEERGVTFVRGNATDPDVLERHRANEARAVILVADDTVADPDAKTALSILALRGLYQDKKSPGGLRPLVCAEAMENSKAKLIRQAGADEVVCHQDYGLGILVQSALGTKVSRVFHELLSYQSGGCEIYFMEGRSSFVDRTFTEVADDLNSQHRNSINPLIVVGVQRGDQIHLNPRNQFRILENDILIVIAWDRPKETGERSPRPGRFSGATA